MKASKQTIVVASDNPGKIKEITSYFDTLPFSLVSQSAFSVPAIEETGLSFVENALLKARNAAQYSELPALADDSGLVVAALGDEPGLYSARYAGVGATDTDNIQKLLKKAETLPEEKRQATFYCALVWVRHTLDPVPIICLGRWEGQLLKHPQGTAGFGYDPIFYVPETGCSAAEIPLHQKNAISHRGKAMKILLNELFIL